MHVMGSKWFAVAWLAAAGAAVLLSGACSENAGETVRQTPVEGETETGRAVLSISAREYSLVPDRLQVREHQATEIRFKNDGSERHSFSVYEDDEYKEPVEDAHVESTGPGETKTLTFDPPPGAHDLYFRCEIHHEMTGEIEIGPSSGG